MRKIQLIYFRNVVIVFSVLYFLSVTKLQAQLIVDDDTEPRVFSSLNPMNGSNPDRDRVMLHAMEKINLSDLFEPKRDFGFKMGLLTTTTEYSGTSEPNVGDYGAMAKLQIFSHDPSSPDGIGELIFGMFSDQESTDIYIGKSWNVNVGSVSPPFTNQIATTISSKRSAGLAQYAKYIPDPYSENCSSTPGAIDTDFDDESNWIYFTDIDQSEDSDQRCGYWSEQPVIIKLTAKNVEIDSISAPGIGKVPGEFFDMIDRKRALRKYDPNYTIINAHRCFWRDYPEGSEPAILAAMDLDVDVIEFDIVVTSDNVPILCHDSWTNRLFSGNDPDSYVSSHTLAEFRDLTLRDRFGRVTDYPVVTLEEGLELVRNKKLLYIDDKTDPSNPQTPHPSFVQSLRVVREKNMLNQVMFTAPDSYQGMMQGYPEFKRGDLMVYPVYNNDPTDALNFLGDPERTTGFAIRIRKNNNAYSGELNFASQVVSAKMRYYFYNYHAQFFYPDSYAFMDEPILQEFDPLLDDRGNLDFIGIEIDAPIIVHDRGDLIVNYLNGLGKRNEN